MPRIAGMTPVGTDFARPTENFMGSKNCGKMGPCHLPRNKRRSPRYSHALMLNAVMFLESSMDWGKQTCGGPCCPQAGRFSEWSST
jgi:hypothetical protein